MAARSRLPTGHRSTSRAYHHLLADNLTAPVEMQVFSHVQALVFDVFGTVVDWRSGIAREGCISCAALHRLPIQKSSLMPGDNVTWAVSK